uniref:Uncharacterized protein n=1 Tax=Parascaris equorum TaxID=6256 RepID=A0A914RZ36_PAREQ
MCQIMFCAGPNGCPPSNCLDSGTNELFMSHGRKKRSVTTNQTEETLSAIIRVLAKGEEEDELNSTTFVNGYGTVYFKQFFPLI